MNGTESGAESERGQLLPAILDRRAQSNPDRVWAKFPGSSTSYDQGFRAATYGQICNAVNRVAWMLAETIGPSAEFDTLAYLGPSDLRYHVVILAAIKTGYKAFLPSPRNSTVAQKDLLTRLECRVLATTADPQPPFVSSILREYPVQTVVNIPPLDELLRLGASDHVRPYPYTKSFDAARHDPVFVLHTSGSTGIPKPMVYTNEFVWRIFKANTLPALPGTTRVDDLFLRGEFFSFLPAFHVAGIGWGLVLPMFSESIPVLPLPGRPPSTDGFLEALKYGRFDWAFLLPVIIDDVSKDDEALELVASQLNYVFYTGGAVPGPAGEAVSSKIPIFSGLGSSECSALPQLRVLDHISFTDIWKYLHIHPASGAEFRSYVDDLHEMVIVKSTACPEAQPVFAMFPHLDKYETRDLFSPHPSIPGLWRHRGRRDDIVVFLNGEKTNPISFEQDVSRHAAVKAALVAGSQRFEACLLIESSSTGILSDTDKAALVQDIWPVVEDANRHCPAHARISKAKILILDPDRPMLRAGKGTMQREGTLRLYAAEIDALYSKAEGQGQGQGQPPRVLISSLEDVVKSLRALVADVTSWSHFDNDTDFFSTGMDSLQVLGLSGAIRSGLGIPSVSPAVIYRNPSIDLLAKEVYHADSGTMATAEDTVDSRTATMEQLLRHYEQKIDQIATKGLTPPTNESTSSMPTSTSTSQVVLLTGSTGTVGSFLLNRLLTDSNVFHIYCLNRAHDSVSLQAARNRQRGLPCDDFPPDRVTFLTVNLARDHFGLDSTTYTTLVDSATQILHAAWPVDFNQPLRYFQPSLDGLVGLLSFAHDARQRPSLLFLSSVSAVSSYQASTIESRLIPEEPIPDVSCPAAIGYGESKFLAERLLAYAATKESPSTRRCSLGVVRIGQVAGTATDSTAGRGRGCCCWNRTEWLPSLILSSRHLGALPDSLGQGGSIMESIDWVPVDELAGILVELSFHLSEKSKPDPTASLDDLHVFHCINPHPTPWADLVPVIVRVLSASLGSQNMIDKTGTEEQQENHDAISVVGFREWLARLDSSATSTEQDGAGEPSSFAKQLEKNPALKLLDFYHQLVIDSRQGDAPSARLSSLKTVSLSKALADLGPIRAEWMGRWVRDWLVEG
ncbi:acetyl-CoA synthetase-like protein [Parathielavia hyrcaniae]|uniref:Acetyl-CoA synthetase-like protein n=1 Tax=Parathielavia hyrcaniae TaxID=113614 RepID=A0AAN6QAT2_9PEZI|nr:acetyl-CoA synthetase-like protein [Parathielavia hyrcaniae]